MPANSQHSAQLRARSPINTPRSSSDVETTRHAKRADALEVTISNYNEIVDELLTLYMYAFNRLGIPTLAVAHVKLCEKEIENALHALKDMKRAELQKATESKESARGDFKKAVDSFKVTKQACYSMCCSTFPESVVRSNYDKEIDEAMRMSFGSVLHVLESQSIVDCDIALQYWRQYKEGINKLSTYCEKAYHKIKDKKEAFLKEYDTGTLVVQDEKVLVKTGIYMWECGWQERTDIMQKVDEIKEERQKVAEIMERYYRKRETLLQDTQQTMARFREFIAWKNDAKIKDSITRGFRIGA